MDVGFKARAAFLAVQPWTTDFIYLSLHFLICQMGTTVPTSWAGLSEIIALHLSSIHYIAGGFFWADGEPVVKTKSWTQWSLHSTGQHKNLENNAKKKKKSFQGVISPRHYGKEDAGTQRYCWLGVGVEFFWESWDLRQRPKLSEDRS